MMIVDGDRPGVRESPSKEQSTIPVIPTSKQAGKGLFFVSETGTTVTGFGYNP
jgi:hypothetical protein